MTESANKSNVIEPQAIDETLSPESPDEEAADPFIESEPALPVESPILPGPAELSPDGSTLAYLQRDNAGILSLWLSPLDGGEPRAVPLTIDLLESGDAPQWSPDGAWLALSGSHPADSRSAIYILNAENGSARMLADHPGADSMPRWSPDGTMIAFISRRDGRDSVSVAFVDSVGSAVQMTQGAHGQDDHDLCWSTDGARIAFARRTVEGEVVGDHLWTVNVATGETKQVTKRLANRKQLTWSPDRALILHISDDGDWENVAVVNADNSAGWNVASEAGDKSDPRYSKDGGRVVYTRRKDGVVRCCERAASSSSAVELDPGAGIAISPRFLPDKRVVYLFQPATGSPRFLVQEAKADAERTELPRVTSWSTDRTLITPRHLEIEIGGKKLGALIYQMSETSGPMPAVIYLADRPDRDRISAFDPTAQALAASGLAVIAPSLPGSPGYGRKVANALKDQVASETEVADLLVIREAIAKIEGIDYGRIAVVGHGHGGTLALLLAGSRPGQVQAVVAIDPIADWDLEFDLADADLRAWMTKTFGIPATSRGVYALRTPSTFVGVIDAALMIIGTDRAPAGRAAQLDELTADMRELEVSFEHEVSLSETEWDTALKAAAFIRRSLSSVVSPIDARMEQVLDAAAV